jgi:Methyltransferase domain
VIDLSIPGQMSESELRGIENLARKAPKEGCVVEVGSLYGLSSFRWATSVDPSVTVHCIDPWVREPWIVALVESRFPRCPEFGLEAFRTFTASCRNIVPHQGCSPQDFKNWDRPVDIFFDDAVHHNPFIRESLRFWLTKMRPGGIMCGHDYCKQWPDVIAEVNKLASELGVFVNTRQWLWWIELPRKTGPIRSPQSLWPK